MLNNEQQQAAIAKMDKAWLSLDELFILKRLLEVMDEVLNSSNETLDAKDEKIQLLLNLYREKFEIHFHDSRKGLIEIDNILRGK